MSKGAYKRYSLFAGFGVGAGFGFGCGVGAGTGVGGTAFKAPALPPLPELQPSLPRTYSTPSAPPRPPTPHGVVRLNGDAADRRDPDLPRPHSYFVRRARELLREPISSTALPILGAPLRRVNVRFAWAGGAASAVRLAGSFNAWGASLAMRCREVDAGVWEVVLRLAAGRYFYRYLVDGVWRVDERTVVVGVPGRGDVNELVVDAAAAGCGGIARLPGFGAGGGCGLGFGAGWGFFGLGVGVVVRGLDDLTGRTRRKLRRVSQQVRLEREAGVRPPRRDPSVEEGGMDPLLDRIIRHIETRRASQRRPVRTR